MRPFLRPEFPMFDNKYDRINTLASKELDRRSVADSVARFLASGGFIQQIAQNAGTHQAPSYSNCSTRKRRTTSSKGQFA